MLSKNRYTVPLVMLLLTSAFFSCTKKWEDHNQVTDSKLEDNVMQAIAKTANLSRFSALLTKSGYDKILGSSKNFTVWAPTDQALQTLDPAVESDSARLKQFVGNHITNQSYLTGAFTSGQRIRMLNGKYIGVTAASFDSANIVSGNNFANNGIFHTIDKFIPRINNIWEFVNNTALVPQMKSFLLSLNYLKFDPAQAIQTGVDPVTGLPAYQAGTGNVQHNTFIDTVLNVSNESDQYTLILLTDNAYKREFDKLTPWFQTQTQNADSTNRLSGYWLVKDLAFKGSYTAAQLPDTMLSLSGVKVPIEKSSIVASYRTSNGMVHIMSNVNFNLNYKFPPIIIQGENPTSFSADRTANTFYRIIRDSANNRDISEIFLQNYNAASFSIRYAVPNLNSMRYKISWVVVNDFNVTWQQRLAVDSSTNVTSFPYTAISTVKSFSEVPVGDITVRNFRNLNLFVVGPATASSTGNVNLIAVDYIKLAPAF